MSCDAFDNFLPPILRPLQIFGRSEAMLGVTGQGLRLRTIQRLPIAFGRLTVRPIEPEIMASYTRLCASARIPAATSRGSAV